MQKLKEPIELVRVTPLRIIFKDSQLGAQLINPLLEATGAERSEIFNQITTIACQLSSILFAGDVGLTIASGSGSLAVQVGGVQAYADDTVSDNPFGLPEAPLGIGPATETPGSTTTTPSSPASSAPGRTLTSAPGGSEGCESVHPFHWPPCSRGAPWLFGLLGLAGVGHGRDRLASPTPGAGQEARGRIAGVIFGTRDTVKDLAYSYGPLALVAVVFLIMTTVVSPLDREEQRLTSTTTTEEGTTIASGPGGTRTTAEQVRPDATWPVSASYRRVAIHARTEPSRFPVTRIRRPVT